MEIENEFRFRDALSNPMNLFLGAGFSVLASGSHGLLPIGEALAVELREQFDIDAAQALRLDQLSTILARSRREDLSAFLRDRYSVKEFDARYSVLTKLPVASIFTTNIDNLISRIYETSENLYLNDVYAHGAASSSRDAVELVQLHGCVDDLSRQLTFSTLDIAAARTSDPDQWSLFRQRLRTRPTLFWGYAMADSGTLEAVRATGSGAPTEGDAWIQVRPGKDAQPATEYFRALGFQVLVGDTEELLEYLSDFAAVSPAEQSAASHSLENVPLPGSTVARPIEDYFLGYPPTWSDIYSRGVAQTSHLRVLQDRVAARRNTVVTGIPGCGKTTLLMQLAAFTTFPGPKMMFDGLPAARAELIARQVGDAAALIILDNAASDIRSFEILGALRNAIVVAADREYNLGSVSSRLKDAHAEILPVSDLRSYDLQYLWDAIPARIRGAARRDPEVEAGRTASAFEFILANVVKTPLGDKLIESIHDMHDEGSLHADMLLAASYLHFCGTSLTMDVLVAHFRGLINDYQEIYRVVDQLGALLTDSYRGDQDEFTARSRLVAEQVLKHVRPSILRAFLTRFHLEVSPLRVAKYDTFRRRAYSWSIFSRAFPSPPEGIEIYDSITARDDSPEVLQQKALYLADKRLYEEAFFELDRARSSTRRTSWSIENSYFNVLFKSNIDRASFDLESREQCKSALLGLDDCYVRDRRKGLHSLVYAECAKTYSVEVDDGEESRRFLLRAEEMLTEVMESEPWLYRPPILIRQVRRALRGLPNTEHDEEFAFND